jgi:hypothetical protein
MVRLQVEQDAELQGILLSANLQDGYVFMGCQKSRYIWVPSVHLAQSRAVSRSHCCCSSRAHTISSRTHKTYTQLHTRTQDVHTNTQGIHTLAHKCAWSSYTCSSDQRRTPFQKMNDKKKHGFKSLFNLCFRPFLFCCK